MSQKGIKRKTMAIQLRKERRVNADKRFAFSCHYKQLPALLIILLSSPEGQNTFYIEKPLLAAAVVGVKGKRGKV